MSANRQVDNAKVLEKIRSRQVKIILNEEVNSKNLSKCKLC